MRYFLSVMLFAALLSCPIARAQAPAPSVDELQRALQAANKDAAALRDAATKLSEQNDDLRKRVEGKEADLWAHYYKAKESEYDFQIEMMTINSRSFVHQNVASYVILGLVVFVVLGGLYFAQVQLMAGLQPIAAISGAPAAPVEAAAAPIPSAPGASLGATTLAAEVGKVTVTSSVVGVIVLVISFAFLYIYTREVYHIQIIDPYKPALRDPAVTAEPAKGNAPTK